MIILTIILTFFLAPVQAKILFDLMYSSLEYQKQMKKAYKHFNICLSYADKRFLKEYYTKVNIRYITKYLITIFFCPYLIFFTTILPIIMYYASIKEKIDDAVVHELYKYDEYNLEDRIFKLVMNTANNNLFKFRLDL